jgi:organic radical activating enzyme
MIFERETWFCCPDWMDIPHSEWSSIRSMRNLKEVWNNDIIKKVRNSILDGSYKYCSKTKCPYLSKLVNSTEEELKTKYTSKNPDSAYFDYFYNKDKFLEKFGLTNDSDWEFFPKLIYFNFDKSCNLKCPSCRTDLIPNSKNKITEKIIESIDNQFSSEVEVIHITGSGDPFYSNAFRTYLQNFNPTKYPKLKSIYIVSNGNMFTKKMWESMPNIHPYVKELEISIDAATKDTYENKVRLNGDWDKLTDNLKYLSTLKFNNLVFSFVIQDHNVHEILKFKELIKNSFDYKKTPYTIMYRAIQDWNHQSKEWINERSVQNPSHPKHQELLNQLKSLGDDFYIIHNLWHLITENNIQLKTLI